MKKSHPMAVRLDQDVKDALEADAETQDREQAWLINSILRAHYKLPKPAKPKAGKAKG